MYWDALQKFFLCHQDGLIMMNNGTVGPMPEPVFNTLAETFRIQATRPCDVYNYFPTRRDEVKRKVARFLGADAEEVAITRNTTEGMNFVANGLQLEPGDEVLLHDMEVDFLAASPYKWLGAPTGIGILYVRRDVQDRLIPTIASSGWDTREDIGKLETLGQRADPLLFALGEAVEFQTVVGKDRIERRIQSLARRA